MIASTLTLCDIVKESCAALEEEDSFFRYGVESNTNCPHQKGGILRIINERYYQFILARHFSGSLPFAVKVEDCNRDITLLHQNSESQNKRFAVLELKCWMSESGLKELPGIKRDIYENLKADISKTNTNNFIAEHGYMLIFSANFSINDIKINLEFLANHLDTKFEAWEFCCFKTVTRDGLDIFFWVAGYDVN